MILTRQQIEDATFRVAAEHPELTEAQRRAVALDVAGLVATMPAGDLSAAMRQIQRNISPAPMARYADTLLVKSPAQCTPITFSDGTVWPSPVLVIDEDLHNERPGYFRAFHAAAVDADHIVTVFGYASAGHSFRTIKATIADLRRAGYREPVYRNGRRVD